MPAQGEIRKNIYGATSEITARIEYITARIEYIYEAQVAYQEREQDHE